MGELQREEWEKKLWRKGGGEIRISNKKTIVLKQNETNLKVFYKMQQKKNEKDERMECA